MTPLSIPQMQDKALRDPERQIREHWGKKLVQRHVKNWNRAALNAIIADDRYEPEVQGAASAGLPKITAAQVKRFLQSRAEASLRKLLELDISQPERQAVANAIKQLPERTITVLAATDSLALKDFVKDPVKPESYRKLGFKALAASFVEHVRNGMIGWHMNAPSISSYAMQALCHTEKPDGLAAELGDKTKEKILLEMINEYALNNDNTRLLILGLLPAMPPSIKDAALKKAEPWLLRVLDEYVVLGMFEELDKITSIAGIPAVISDAASARKQNAYLNAVVIMTRGGEYAKLKSMADIFKEGPVCEAIGLGIEQAAKKAAETSNDPAVLNDITLDPTFPRQVRIDAGLGLRGVLKENVAILREIEANPDILPEVRTAFQKAILPFDIETAKAYVSKEVAYGHEFHSSLWKVVKDMPASNIELVCNAAIFLCAEYITGKPSPGIKGIDEYIAAAEPATVKANAREALIRIANESRLPAGVWQTALQALEPMKTEPFKAPLLFRNPALKSWFKSRPEAQKRRI